MKQSNRVLFEYVQKGLEPPSCHVFIDGVEVASVLNSTVTTTRDRRTTVTLEFEARVEVQHVEVIA